MKLFTYLFFLLHVSYLFKKVLKCTKGEQKKIDNSHNFMYSIPLAENNYRLAIFNRIVM